MHNSTLKLEKVVQSKYLNFIQRVNIAFAVLFAGKVFIVIDKEVNVFGMNTKEVATDCSIIYFNLINHLETQQEEERIDKIVHELISEN